MSDIPTPEDTGSAGTQKASEGEIVKILPINPLEGLPIADTIDGLAASKYRSMGGEVTAGLIAGSVRQISHDYQETKKELRTTRDSLNRVRDDLSASEKRVAVLEERLRGKHLRNLSITAGTALLSLSIDFLKNDLNNYSYITIFFGVLLLLFGWFSTKTEGKR